MIFKCQIITNQSKNHEQKKNQSKENVFIVIKRKKWADFKGTALLFAEVKEHGTM